MCCTGLCGVCTLLPFKQLGAGMGHHQGCLHLASPGRILAADEVDVVQRGIQAQTEGGGVIARAVEP